MADTSVYRPPTIQTRSTAVTLGSCPATRPGVLRMPIPSVLPTITARPKPRPRTRRRPVVGVELRLEDNKENVDRVTDIASRVARSLRLELDVARLPSVDDRLAVGGVLDLAARQVHDDGIGAVRVEAL